MERFREGGSRVRMERRAIAIHGTVQGVGFRPFVYALASRLDLGGFVRNELGCVWIEVEGQPGSLDQFLHRLSSEPPPLARIDDLTWKPQAPRGDVSFRIEDSACEAAGPIVVSPDIATCDDCLAELFDPFDRRHGYPFINCTNCGPRLTIVTGAPYDRVRTTMAPYELCAACRAEYQDPLNRRFHAQAIACPACGPRLSLLGWDGRPLEGSDPIAFFAGELRAGRIGALKGLGGFHLACDARSEAAVEELRRRKHRDEKPFAIMVRRLEDADGLCQIGPEEPELLCSSRRPIVLLRKRVPQRLADGVAPENPFLGVMLPYTPLHHLLLRAMGGTPLVMTSGNRTDEPIAIEDQDAIERLSGIADLFLTHDRRIQVRCDDSVTRVAGGTESPVRRSRGSAPEPIPLPLFCPAPILAAGGQLKSTFALGSGGLAFLSHHLGDLDHYQACRSYEADVLLYQRLFEIEPEWVAHDLHPDYASTRYALRREAEEHLRPLAVQHHHAHMASCMAENGLLQPVIGVTFDGTGYGEDGAIWGGEFLVGDYRRFRRAAHLRYVGLPGGEQAIREPWRMALAHLLDARLGGGLLAGRVPHSAILAVEKMLERRFNAPPTSSVGRLFDAAASLAGVRDRVSYEGQAAMGFEWLASRVPPAGAYPFDLCETREAEGKETLVIDTRPLIRAIAEEAARREDRSLIARRFHSTLVEMVAAVCCRIRNAEGIATAVLSGGSFMNAILSAEAGARLEAEGFRVHRHRLVPPNDGGLSLGQLAVAAARIDPAAGGARSGGDADVPRNPR